MIWNKTVQDFLYCSVCMTGAVHALAAIAIVITTSVLALTGQTIHLWAGKRVSRQKKRHRGSERVFQSTSALLMNCSVAVFSFSLCPLQARRADACRALPKEKVRTQGLARGQLLMALRWTDASSSL